MGQVGKAPLTTGSFLLVYALAFIPYAAAIRAVFRKERTPSFAFVLLIAALLRLLVFPAAPSDDVNRYVWEGRIQHEGVNPYRVAPSDARLAPLRDESWGGINHPDLTAIYPPATQLVFRLLSQVGFGPRQVKAAMAILDLAVVLALAALLRARGVPTGRVIVYAWSPLAVFQVAGRGHQEPLLLLPMLLAVLALEGASPRRILGGSMAALGVMAKWVGGPLLLVWFRKLRPKGLVAAACLALLLWLPYADAGFAIFQTLQHFHADFHFADSLNALAGAVLGPAGGRLACAIALLAVTATLAIRQPDPAWAARGVLGATLLLSPTVHPWYFLWVLPWAALGRPWGWVALTATVPLYAGALEVIAGSWDALKEVAWWKALAYAIGGVIWMVDRGGDRPDRAGRKEAGR
jgi:hypothetical protein